MSPDELATLRATMLPHNMTTDRIAAIIARPADAAEALLNRLRADGKVRRDGETWSADAFWGSCALGISAWPSGEDPRPQQRSKGA
jgi:hypothetical protein